MSESDGLDMHAKKMPFQMVAHADCLVFGPLGVVLITQVDIVIVRSFLIESWQLLFNSKKLMFFEARLIVYCIVHLSSRYPLLYQNEKLELRRGSKGLYLVV